MPRLLEVCVRENWNSPVDDDTGCWDCALDGVEWDNICRCVERDTPTGWYGNNSGWKVMPPPGRGCCDRGGRLKLPMMRWL